MQISVILLVMIKGCAFDDLDSRLSLSFAKLVKMPSTPANSTEDARYASQDVFILGNQRCPIQSRPQSVLGARSFYVERNNGKFHPRLLP